MPDWQPPPVTQKPSLALAKTSALFCQPIDDARRADLVRIGCGRDHWVPPVRVR